MVEETVRHDDPSAPNWNSDALDIAIGCRECRAHESDRRASDLPGRAWDASRTCPYVLADALYATVLSAHDAAIEAALTAGATLRVHYPHLHGGRLDDSALQTTLKDGNPTDVVTLLDKSTESYLREFLAERCPAYG